MCGNIGTFQTGSTVIQAPWAVLAGVAVLLPRRIWREQTIFVESCTLKRCSFHRSLQRQQAKGGLLGTSMAAGDQVPRCGLDFAPLCLSRQPEKPGKKVVFLGIVHYSFSETAPDDGSNLSIAWTARNHRQRKACQSQQTGFRNNGQAVASDLCFPGLKTLAYPLLERFQPTLSLFGALPRSRRRSRGVNEAEPTIESSVELRLDFWHGIVFDEATQEQMLAPWLRLIFANESFSQSHVDTRVRREQCEEFLLFLVPEQPRPTFARNQPFSEIGSSTKVLIWASNFSANRFLLILDLNRFLIVGPLLYLGTCLRRPPLTDRFWHAARFRTSERLTQLVQRGCRAPYSQK